MKISISEKEARKIVNIFKLVCARSVASYELDFTMFLKFIVKNKKLYVFGMRNSLFFCKYLSNAVCSGQGSLYVKFSLFNKVSSFMAKDIVIEGLQKKIKIDNGKSEIEIDNKSFDNEWPDLSFNEPNGTKIYHGVDVTGMKFVRKAIGPDLLRPSLDGVWFDGECFFGTDGHRLHRVVNSTRKTVVKGKRWGGIIGWGGDPCFVHFELVNMILSVGAEEIDICVWDLKKSNGSDTVRTATKVSFAGSEFVFVCHDHEELKMVPYDEVISMGKNGSVSHVFEANEIDRLLKVAVKLGDNGSCIVLLKDRCLYFSNDIGDGSLKFKTVSTSWNDFVKESCMTGVSPRLLTDAMCGHGSDVLVKWDSDDISVPFFIEAGNCSAVVMPMRNSR